MCWCLPQWVPEVQTHSKPFIILALKTDLRRVAGSSVITEEEVRCSPSTGGVRRSQRREHSISPPPTLVVAVLPLCHTRAVSLLRTSGHRATPVSPLTLSISVPCPWRCSYALSRGFGTGHERPAHANPGVVPGTHTLPQGPMAPHLTQSFGGWTGAHEVPQFGSIRRRQAPNSNKRKEAQCHL